MHDAIADRLREDPALLEAVRARLARGRSSDDPGRAHWAREWGALVDGPLEALTSFMVERSEHATHLRKSSPFAGILTPRERWAIWRATRPD